MRALDAALETVLEIGNGSPLDSGAAATPPLPAAGGGWVPDGHRPARDLPVVSETLTTGNIFHGCSVLCGGGGGAFFGALYIYSSFCFLISVRLAVAPSWTLTGYRPARDLLILSKAKNHETIFHHFSLLFRGGGSFSGPLE